MSEHISEETTFESTPGFTGADVESDEIRLDGTAATGDQEKIDATRLRLLGIEVADRMPEAEAAAAELLPPEVAVRLRVVGIVALRKHRAPMPQVVAVSTST